MTQLGATRFNLFDLYHTEDDRGEKQLYAIYDDLPLHLGMEVDVADSQRKVYLVLLVLFLSSLERTVLFASRNQGTLLSRRVNSWNLYVKFPG